jgi:hypothetical protein
VLRGAGTRRFLVIPPEQLALDAPPDAIEPGFDVVFTGVPAAGGGRSLLAAQALLADGGQLVVVASRAASLRENEAGVATGQSEVQLERRIAALLRELVECEAALVESDDRRDALQNELRAMKMSVGWRVTLPLRWVQALARRR